MRVKSIKYAGEQDVYCMDVPDHHNFLVNGGIVSHNCMDATRYYLYTRYGKDKRARSHSTQDTTDPIYRRGDLTLIGKKYIDKEPKR